MNKKVEKQKKQYDDQEDLEIKSVAYFKNSSQILLLIVLILLFGFTLYNSLLYIGKYYLNKNKMDSGMETIEISNEKNNVLIVNDREIEKEITKEDIEDGNIILTSISTIELETNKNYKEKGNILFDVKYDILENSFPDNISSKSDTDVKLKISYSFDNKNWTYINNVISTVDSTINPLMGNYYDISGIVSHLKIATNYNLSSEPGEVTKMYWKCETIISGKKENVNKKLKANFNIEYKESA